jgi:hypothetical protein
MSPLPTRASHTNDSCSKNGGTTINMSIDPSTILSVLGGLAKPYLTSIGNAINSIPEITIPPVTTPPVIDYRTNFTNAYTKAFPGTTYDEAYIIADSIYKTNISYYSSNADLGTIQGQVVGLNDYQQELSFPSKYTKPMITTPMVTTPIVTTPVNTSLPIYFNLYEIFASLYAWGYYKKNSYTNIKYFLHFCDAAYQYAIISYPSKDSILNGILDAYFKGSSDSYNILSNITTIPTTPLPIYMDYGLIYITLYTFGYASNNNNGVTLLTAAMKFNSIDDSLLESSKSS